MIDVSHLSKDLIKEYSDNIFYVHIALKRVFDLEHTQWGSVLTKWKEANEKYGVDDCYLYRFKKAVKKAVSQEDADVIGKECMVHLAYLHEELKAYLKVLNGEPCRSLKDITNRLREMYGALSIPLYDMELPNIECEMVQLHQLIEELRMTYLKDEIPANKQNQGPQKKSGPKEDMGTFKFVPRKDITNISHDDYFVYWDENSYTDENVSVRKCTKEFVTWAEMQIFIEQLRLLAEDCQV